MSQAEVLAALEELGGTATAAQIETAICRRHSVSANSVTYSLGRLHRFGAIRIAGVLVGKYGRTRLWRVA